MTHPIRLFAALAAAALFLSGPAAAAQDLSPGNKDADEVIMFSEADEAMNSAILEAQATLPEWLGLLADPPVGVGDFTFKFPLEGVEHIWVINVRRDGDDLLGQLANRPHAVGWSLGDAVRVPLRDVSDWGYWDAKGSSHGYRTIRVMLDYMAPAEADAVRDYYGW